MKKNTIVALTDSKYFELLSELIDSNECNIIADKLRKIKTLKTNIKDFLEKKGLWDENVII